MKAGALNVIMLGRLLAIVFIACGISLAFWDAREQSVYFGVPHYRLFSFSKDALQFIFLGGLLLAITEFAASYGSPEPAGRIDWRFTTLLRVLGATMVVGGISLTIWSAMNLHGSTPIRNSNAILGFSSIVHSGSKRAITRSAIEYAWQGGLLILAAEIADRLRWDQRGEEAADEPVLPEPPSQEPEPAPERQRELAGV